MSTCDKNVFFVASPSHLRYKLGCLLSATIIFIAYRSGIEIKASFARALAKDISIDLPVEKRSSIASKNDTGSAVVRSAQSALMYLGIKSLLSSVSILLHSSSGKAWV